VDCTIDQFDKLYVWWEHSVICIRLICHEREGLWNVKCMRFVCLNEVSQNRDAPWTSLKAPISLFVPKVYAICTMNAQTPDNRHLLMQ